MVVLTTEVRGAVSVGAGSVEMPLTTRLLGAESVDWVGLVAHDLVTKTGSTCCLQG